MKSNFNKIKEIFLPSRVYISALTAEETSKIKKKIRYYHPRYHSANYGN